MKPIYSTAPKLHATPKPVKPEPSTSWWIGIAPEDFVLTQRREQARMSSTAIGSAGAMYPKASGEPVE